MDEPSNPKSSRLLGRVVPALDGEEPEPEPTGVTVVEDVRIGRTFDAFRVLRIVSVAGVGVIYEADDEKRGRRVAMKFLPELLRRVQDPDATPFADAVAAGKLEHDNIVAVLETGRNGGACYLVMELLQPKSAAVFLQQKGALPWGEATAVVADCCAALAAAHASGLLHRGVKPSNVLVSAAGTTKLCDFGAEREFPSRDPAARKRPSSPYASPEQLRGEALDALSDLYSLGATYFALLTGRPPERAALEGEEGRGRRVRSEPRAPVVDLPEPCARVVARAMSRDPAERYRSAKEMRAELEAALKLAPEAPRRFLIAADPEEQIAVLEPRGVSILPPKPAPEPPAEAEPKPDAEPMPTVDLEGRDRRAGATTLREIKHPLEIARSSHEVTVPDRPRAEIGPAPSTPPPAYAPAPAPAPANPWKLVSLGLLVALVLVIGILLGRGR